MILADRAETKLVFFDAASVAASRQVEFHDSTRRMDRQKMEEGPMAKTEKTVEARRDFLKLARLGTVLGGAALAVGSGAQAAETAEEAGSGYRETAHVKTYYDSTRF